MIKKTYGKRDISENRVTLNSYRELLEYRRKTVPDVPVFRTRNYSTGEEISVLPEEFSKQADALGAWLAEKGYRRTHIAVLGENSYQWVLLMFAVICSDNVLVTVDKGLEFSSIQSIIGRSDSRVLFYSKGYEDHAVRLKEQYGLEAFPLEEADRYAAGRLASGEVEQIPTDPDAMAILMYTSGTTGPSKGVMLSQRNTMHNLSSSMCQTDLSGDSVYLLPLNHIYGLVPALLMPFINGNTSTINQNLRYMMQDIASTRPQILFLVPLFLETMYSSLWKGIRAKGLEDRIREIIEQNRARGTSNDEKREMFKDILAAFGGRLTRIVSGGAPLSLRLYEGFKDFGIEVLNGYGITETSPVLAVNLVDCNKPESVGRIVAGEEVRINDPDASGDGEICVRGTNVMLGYYRDEERTAESLRDGWFFTGDKGFLDEDYNIHINGRIKNLIILSNGENVSPEELEELLYQNEAVLETLVYEKDGKIAAELFLDADYLARSGIEDGEAFVRKYIADLNKELAVYKRIGTVLFRDTPFERTSSKKIKRHY